MRSLFLVFALALAPLAMPAEEPNRTKAEWREYVDAQKRVFFNESIGFTQTEGAAFWALYDGFSSDLRRSRRSEREAMKSGEGSEGADYAEIVRRVNREEDVQDSLRSAFRAELGMILPAEKVYRYMKAEDDFKRLLIRDVDCKGQKKKK